MLSGKNKRDIIRQISRDTGMSESSIYKILSNPFNFSKSTVEIVRREAEKYGLGFGGTDQSVSSDMCDMRAISRTGAGQEEGRSRILRIGVMLPSRPVYFWKEAVMGIEKSKAQCEAEWKVAIQLVYAYHNFPFNEEESARLFETWGAERLSGCIIFPVGGESCRRFIEEMCTLPTVIFNDTQDYMNHEWFAAHPNICFIGPDSYDEGRRAAMLTGMCAEHVRHMAVICTHHHHSAQTAGTRIRGMCDHIRQYFPDIRISHITVDPNERIAPANLARYLIACYDLGEVDCVYVSSGVTHIACAAIEKIERRRGRSLNTFVIGHECATADRKYLLEGRQRGYIKQDVYTQGLTAVRDIVSACLGGTTMKQRLYGSSVFIR